MATGTTAQRDWIATEFSKGIDAEHAMISECKARAESPPDPSLQVLYHEIATADERHLEIVETVATRYGHTPSHGMSGGIGETIGRLKGKVGELGASPQLLISHDLAAGRRRKRPHGPIHKSGRETTFEPYERTPAPTRRTALAPRKMRRRVEPVKRLPPQVWPRRRLTLDPQTVRFGRRGSWTRAF